MKILLMFIFVYFFFLSLSSSLSLSLSLALSLMSFYVISFATSFFSSYIQLFWFPTVIVLFPSSYIILGLWRCLRCFCCALPSSPLPASCEATPSSPCPSPCGTSLALWVEKEWPRYCRNVYWALMVQNNEISAFIRAATLQKRGSEFFLRFSLPSLKIFSGYF